MRLLTLRHDHEVELMTSRHQTWQMGDSVEADASSSSAITPIAEAKRALLVSLGDALDETLDLHHDAERVAAAESADAPVARLLSEILEYALQVRASDVHIDPKEGRVHIRFRIDGALCQVFDLPPSAGVALVSRIKILAGMNIVERRRPQDGQLSLLLDGHSVSARIATVATVHGEKCVLRLLDDRRTLLGLEQLGMSGDTMRTFERVVRAPFGMVLCAGPTGSGKTTTLYAALNEVVDVATNAMSIEDPVEYHFDSVNQIQVNEVGGLDFATGLRSILRHDPDIILVGEIRDVETARIAIQSALTGHFVLSSVHATDASSTIHRFLDMGIESFLVASSLLAVIGQRLVRRICDSCKATYTPSIEELEFYYQRTGAAPKEVFFRGEGCEACAGTGYRDRVGVYEVLRVTAEMKQLILRWASREEITALAVAQGMRPMQDAAIELVAQDITTISEVIRTIASGER